MPSPNQTPSDNTQATRRQAHVAEVKALLKLSWPIMIAQLAQMGTGVVDTIMAGRYGAVDLAAVAIGYNIWLPVYLFIVGMLLATTAIVAQDFGAKKFHRIKELLPQSIWLAVILGLIAGPLCYFANPLLDLLNLDAQTQEKSLAYLQATSFGMPAAALFQALRCHTQGIGIMRPFAIASVIGFFANVPLNYAFIYGVGDLPAMGAEGCGWATAISMWLGPLLIAFYMARADSLKPYLPKIQFFAPKLEPLKAIISLGMPIGLTYFFEVGVFSIIGLFIATMGNTAMASHQIALNVWDVIFMPLISISAAMATRIGHAIGAGDKDSVILSVRCGTGIAVFSGLLVTILLLLNPHAIIRAYTDDVAILSMATILVRLAAFFIIIDAIEVSTASTLRAFKDTRFPFLVMAIAYWLIALPLGYWLGIINAENATDGAVGFWKAMIVGIGVATILVLWRQRQLLQKPLPAPER